MNFKKRYDALIELIENNIKKGSTMVMRLVEAEFSSWSPNTVSMAFLYITGMRLKEYIIKRRLIKTLQYSKENAVSIETAAEEYSFSSAERYRIDFKNHFGKIISEIEEEDYQRVAKPLKLDVVLQFEGGIAKVEPTIWELPESEYNRLKEVLSFSDFFDFTPKQDELVFQLTKSLEFPVRSICYFCSDFFDHDYEVKNRYRDVNIQNLAFLCLRLNKSVREGLEMMLEIDENCIVPDYRKIEDEVWQILSNDSYQFDYERCPSLVISVVEKMKESGLALDSVDDVFERLEWIEDVDEAIGFDWDDYGVDPNEESILRDMYKNQNEIEATYTNEFLGLSVDDN